MYKKLILLILGLISTLFILIVFVFQLLKGNNNVLVPIICVVIYIIFICKMVYNEYASIAKDKSEGIQIGTFKFLSSSKAVVGSSNNYSGRVTLTNYYFQNTESGDGICFEGDFTDLSLENGEYYEVLYYNHTKVAVEIKKVNSSCIPSYFKNRHKVDNNFDNMDLLRGIIRLFLIGVLLVCLLVITYFVFISIQRSVFFSKSDYLFIRNSNINYIFIFFGIYLLTLYSFHLVNVDFLAFYSRYIIKIKFVHLLIISVLIFIIVLIFTFFSYTIVTPDGIVNCRNPLNINNISWDSIKKVDVYCEKSSKYNNKYTLHYNLISNNECVLNLADSSEFWNSILKINRLIIKKEIPIEKDTISKVDAFILLSNYSFTDNEKDMAILSKIMNVEMFKYP